MIAYKTKYGVQYEGQSENILQSNSFKKYKGKIQLIFTSPPFPLNSKKRYGNLQGEEYIEWLSGFSLLFKGLLKKNGSLVIEIGNAWEPRIPIMSPLSLVALLSILKKGGFNLCQQFIVYNPARLPSPANWVNIKRIRVKDSFTHVWWMSPSEFPKANNRKVLLPYSKAMLKLLEKKEYNWGKRPSEHKIGKKSFLNNNGGSIPSNVLTISNTSSNDVYLKYCKERNIDPHPARMPIALPEFFIKFLTNTNDLVLDPFSGSNTTGEAAEKLKRRWISIEADPNYVLGSKCRFL